jgi:vesicular inhibitory amino acid transporter
MHEMSNTHELQLREWAVAIRVGLIAFTLLIALIVPHFALLMGLIGNITGTMLSFIWPAYFHLRLKKEGLSTWGIITDYGIIVLGLLFGSVGVFYASRQLASAMSTFDEYQ